MTVGYDNVISFVVPGEPVGKGRPRFSRKTGRTYTPEKTANFETLVRFEYHSQTGGFRFDDDAEIGIRVVAVFSIPKSATKKNREQMIKGIILPRKKPDADNCLKAVADALNRIAYADDSAIVHADVIKMYGTEPRTMVQLWRVVHDEK